MITCSHKTATVSFSYNIRPVNVFCVIEIRDLVATLGSSQRSHYDVDRVINFALRTLGVPYRVSKEFQNERILSLLST